MFFYEDHQTGNLYTSETELDYEELYCEQCGDSDRFIGSCNNMREAWNLLKSEISICGSGGYVLQAIYSIVAGAFDIPCNFPRNEDDPDFLDASDVDILKAWFQAIGEEPDAYRVLASETSEIVFASSEKEAKQNAPLYQCLEHCGDTECILIEKIKLDEIKD